MSAVIQQIQRVELVMKLHYLLKLSYWLPEFWDMEIRAAETYIYTALIVHGRADLLFIR